MLKLHFKTWLIAALLAPVSLNAQEILRINGSTTVNPVVTESAEILKKENGLTIHVDTQGGSSGGISALGDGRVDIAMSSRPLNPADQAKYPKVKFHPTKIGADAVAMIVSKDVWNGGIKALTRNQIKGIYEKKITNWQQVGGPNRRIAFFNKEPGRGTWEVFAKWLYGKIENVPPVAHPEVGANEEARNKVSTSHGAISQLSAAWADGKTVFALAIQSDDGKIIPPTAEHIAKGDYPMSRSLWLITNGPPTGNAKTLIDFVISERTHDIIHKHGYLTLDDLK